ncbi:MAG: hypothetical protein AAFR84_01080 [Pseudomonadota bacterium]
MRKIIIIGASLLFLSACALPQKVAIAAREAAIATIDLANAMGIDPWQASPEYLLRLSMACHSATALVTVWNPNVPSLGPAGEALCAVVLKAAAPGKPLPTLEVQA